MIFARSLFVVLALLASGVYAQAVRGTYPPGFVELNPGEVAAGADVTWEARQPLDLDWREYITVDTGARVAVMYLKPGRYVMVADVIDWDARKRFKKTFIIDVEGTPEPVPPTPPAPVPDDLTSFEKTVRDVSRASLVDKALIHQLGDNFATVASMIAAGGIHTTEDAETKLKELNKPLRDGLANAQQLEDLLRQHLKVVAPKGSDVKKTGAVFKSIAKGLKAA